MIIFCLGKCIENGGYVDRQQYTAVVCAECACASVLIDILFTWSSIFRNDIHHCQRTCPCYPIFSTLFPSVPFCSVPFRSVPSRPVPSRPVPSRPVPSRPVPSRPVPSRPVPSRPVPSRPVPSRPVPSRPVPSRPVICFGLRSLTHALDIVDCRRYVQPYWCITANNPIDYDSVFEMDPTNISISNCFAA